MSKPAALVLVLVLAAGCVHPQEAELQTDDAAPPLPESGSATEGTIRNPASTTSSTLSTTPAPRPAGANQTATNQTATNQTAAAPARPWSLADEGWATLEAAKLRPGSALGLSASCSANFLFTNPNGTKAYIGVASHCHESIESDGACSTTYSTIANQTARALLYDPTELPGLPPPATEVGRLVYASFPAMDAAGESDELPCEYNDFALVELYDEYARQANPALWHWGGPTGLATGVAGDGDQLYTFSDGSQRLLSPLRARQGLAYHALGDPATIWRTEASFTTGCLPGDSGSAVLDAEGRALGVLNRGAGDYCEVSYLAPMLEYMMAHGGPRVVLATAEILTTLPV